ncbi:hypothetical protein SPRG_05426 [Saprolegnia parasitica CBS 223.65]|uniref:Uncharacterized protein n=1 Tax=Saprolegnia parasitica (strain CBS 223.65) TaxID=695850 RepID=A0A067CEP3_SAPPC|nr:hypothetical protein SPRG_05426 [Saprolegnia parasitica CBS 223.65]KDO29184.1 hypothetical protein SPRG_05426 [Saprolegnia parasitica CBS 223.65]|eukprot:XP_012200061.1 hypothetical protein SPRG_05426 [Saprolegnia parasitica CBS 223.65]
MADSKMMNEEASEFGLAERDDEDDGSSGRVDAGKMLQAPALAQQTNEILTDASPAVYATHPDFTKLTPLAGSAPLPEDLEAAKAWLRDCPVTAKEWVIFRAQPGFEDDPLLGHVRAQPGFDVAMAAIQELLATIVLTDGFKVSDADASMARGTHLFTNEPIFARMQLRVVKLGFCRK